MALRGFCFLLIFSGLLCILSGGSLLVDRGGGRGGRGGNRGELYEIEMAHDK